LRSILSSLSDDRIFLELISALFEFNLFVLWSILSSLLVDRIFLELISGLVRSALYEVNLFGCGN
jgi:hypothetical protein